MLSSYQLWRRAEDQVLLILNFIFLVSASKEVWKFDSAYPRVWDTQTNQRAVLDSMMKAMGMKDMSDWYRVKTVDFQKHGAGRLLRTRFQGSPCAAVTSVYPEHQWHTWKFEFLPRRHWETVKQAGDVTTFVNPLASYKNAYMDPLNISTLVVVILVIAELRSSSIKCPQS
jgi:hypothetical protein